MVKDFLNNIVSSIFPWKQSEPGNSSLKMVFQNNGSPFVQQSALTKLVCTLCKKYLSALPIYRHPTEGTVCGRCHIDDIEQFVRDELLEHAIEYQKFPCIYYDSGCLESLFPRQVAAHEKRCHYMKFDCPTRVYNNCTWQGTVGHLVQHFENKHPTFILKDCQFEVDFVNNHTENYIMPFAEDMYVVTREANPAEKTFTIIVSYLGSNCDIDKYKYTLTLQSGNRAYRYSLDQDVGKKLELQGQIVREMLHDPVSIIANISIQEAPIGEVIPTGGTKIGDDNTRNPAVDYTQLEELECPVCFHYMVPPIYQCERGHSICGPCKPTLRQCPTCEGAINTAQNFVLERVINNMIYPCKHSVCGCTYATRARDIRQHEASCLFGPFKCPLEDYENCTEVFPVSELLNHIKKNHYESLIELDTISIPIDNSIEENIEEGYVIKHSQQLFKLCFKYDQLDEVFYWAVQLVGPPEECTKYKYELEIIDNNGKNNRLYIKTNCSPLTVKDNMLANEEHFLYLGYDQVSKFIKHQLTYRIRIITEK